MSSNGWFTVSRDIKEHWVWDCEFSNGQAWIDLIMHASHSSDRKKVIKGQMIHWGRGQQIRSIVTLSETWGWSRKRVTKFLKMLEDDGMISVKKGHLTSIISVCNYDVFQTGGTSKVTSNDSAEEHHESIRGTAKVAQITMVTMEDNGNNGKQDSNLPSKADETKSKRFAPPCLNEVYDYMGEYAASKKKTISTEEPEKFINFYESKNWMVGKIKMKDWKASARGWVGRIDDSKVTQGREVSGTNYAADLIEKLNTGTKRF